MSLYWPFGEPSRHLPDIGGPRDEVTALGVLAMFMTVFLALVGDGCPPRDALAITLALGMGGTEVARRMPGGRDETGGRRR